MVWKMPSEGNYCAEYGPLGVVWCGWWWGGTYLYVDVVTVFVFELARVVVAFLPKLVYLDAVALGLVLLVVFKIERMEKWKNREKFCLIIDYHH